VRKEINFCVKTNIDVIGVIENMSGFVCPHCSKCSEIFPPISGGATSMCEKMSVPLMAKVPLEPQLLLSCEKGKCYMEAFPESPTGKVFSEIVNKINDYEQKNRNHKSSS
jgi:nitrogenase subunit NifH